MPGAPSSYLLLVTMPLLLVASLLRVVRPGAPSSVLAPPRGLREGLQQHRGRRLQTVCPRAAGEPVHRRSGGNWKEGGVEEGFLAFWLHSAEKVCVFALDGYFFVG